MKVQSSASLPVLGSSAAGASVYVALLSFGLLGFAALQAGPYQRPGRTERVSVASDGSEVTGFSELPAFSADGRYVVFDSVADNLVPNDANGSQYDVFLHDRVTGATTQVSVSSQGVGGDNASFGARISGDGRYVVFESVADNLTPDDHNGGVRDIFLHDNVSGETTLVSKSIDGAGGNNDSYSAVISRDGRYIAFDSDASNLVPNDTNGASDVFVYDRQTGQLELVSVDNSGIQGNSFSGYPTLSGDGRYVTFNSDATNLGGNVLGLYQVYRHDRVTGETILVSQPTGSGSANGSSYGGSISGDGNLVVFDSDASNLVPADSNSVTDVFVRNIAAATTTRVSVDSAGAESNGYSAFGRISSDGSVVSFQSDATNLIPNDSDGGRDIFVHDLRSGATEMVSVASDGSQATFPANGDPFVNQEVWHPALSADGRFVGWDGTANNLVANDNNGGPDVFVRDRGPVLGIGALSVTPSGGNLDITGWATFSGITVSQAFDPPDDGAAGANNVGGEITAATVIYRVEQADLLFALELLSLPQPPSNGIPCTTLGCPPGVAGIAGAMYAFRFTSGSTTYEVRALRTALTAVPPAVPFFALYNCSSSCTQMALLTGSIGSTGNEVLISLPLQTLDLGAEAALRGLSAYSAIGDAATGPLSTLDQVSMPDATVPTPSVSLGVVPIGTSEVNVTFDTPAALTNGTFSAALTVPSGSGVWARACLGDVCGPAVSWPLQVVKVVSRMTHGSAGSFDVDLTTGNGIECRSGGASGNYTIVFSFANPLAKVAGATVSSGTGSVSGSDLDSNDAHNYIVNLSGITNAQTVVVTLSNLTDCSGNFSASVSTSIGFLLGDVNGSRRVDAADVSAVRQQTLQPITSANFRADINASGRIDAADVSIARQQTLTSLP